MVPADGTHQLDQQVFVVNPLKETAVYVERMPGGVRGGGREAPLYSILTHDYRQRLDAMTECNLIFKCCIIEKLYWNDLKNRSYLSRGAI